MPFPLFRNIDASVTEIPVNYSDFPSDGGVVLIGVEKVLYTQASDKALLGCTRGYDSTVAAAHLEGATVSLVSATVQEFSFKDYRLTDVADPAANQDVATKKYVDDNSGGSTGPSKYLGRTSGGTSLTDGVEAPVNFTTAANPDALTIGQSPWSFTVSAPGWVDLTASIEVYPTIPCTGYLVLWINDVWAETMDWKSISDTARHLEGNIKIPVTSGQVLKVIAYLEGSGGNVIPSADGGRVQLFYYAD